MTSTSSHKAGNAQPLPLPRLIGLTPRPIDLLPLLRDGLLSQLWSCEAPDPRWIETFDVKSFSLESELLARGRWRGSDLDRLLAYMPRLLKGLRSEHPTAVIPYGVSDGWRGELCRQSDWLQLPPGLSLAAHDSLSDKIAMRSWLHGLGVPLPSQLVVGRADLRWRYLSAKLGASVVLQVPTGSAGVGTEHVQAEADLERAKTSFPAVDRWLASSYAGDVTLNLHGLVTRRREVVVAGPSVQISGVAAVGSGFGQYCGSDFHSPSSLPELALSRSESAARKIGLDLSRRGYLGVFGVDCSLDGDTISVLEVNGRLQASTWLLGELEREAGQRPTMTRHVIEALGQRTSSPVPVAFDQGAQLVLRHTGLPGYVVREVPTGVYSLDAAGLEWLRYGVGLLDCGPQEIVIADVPRPGILVQPGAVLGRVISRTSLTNNLGQGLTTAGTHVVEGFYRLADVVASDAEFPAIDEELEC